MVLNNDPWGIGVHQCKKNFSKAFVMTCFPQRILSLAPSNTEILFDLGLGGSIAGVTEYCLFPPEAKLKPRLKGWVSIPAEKILELHPDLVATSTICQEALRKKLEAAGIPLIHLDPRNLAGIRESFLQLGRATGQEKAALRLAEKFDAEGAALRALTDPASARPRVYCEEWQKPPAVSGNWVPELIAEAGADYFPLAPGELSRKVSLEEMQAFDPEIVILSICGKGLEPDPAELLRRPGWEKISAVRQGQVFTLDDSLFNCPGPRVFEGARLVQRLVRAFQEGDPPPVSPWLRNL
jgi:iron complex transport system substrate-binding protein